MIPLTLVKGVLEIGSQIGASVITKSAVSAVVNTENLKTIPKISVKIATFGIAAALSKAAADATNKTVDDVVEAVSNVSIEIKKSKKTD